jgi:hypothetical protein
MGIGSDIFFHRQLLKFCEERLEPVKASLFAGDFKDIGEARWMAGYIKAITDILEDAEDLRKRIIES